MEVRPAAFDVDVPTGGRRAIVRRSPGNLDEVEMVEASWGSDPASADGTSFRFIRSEGREFPTNRCLVPASEFRMKIGQRRYRVTLDGGNFFYLAAIWEPATADWPTSFRIVTVAANAEVARFQDRHGAIIHRRQVMTWLDATAPEAELLVTPPARIFKVEEIGADARQLPLSL